MDLFIQPNIEFVKTAGEVELPEDPNTWPKEILDELYKQVPYISDFQPHVVMSKVDSERRYGLGHVEISNESEAQMGTDPSMLEAAGVRSVRIPIVIRDGKLSPFDLLVNDASKVMPLTESRLRQAIFRPQAFDVTSQTPGDQSMIGQLYPPYRQNYGFGGGGVTLPGGGMGKAGSALEAYLEKAAAELTQTGRERIKEKNFAIPKGNGPGDTGKYPIHDTAHAKNALTRVDAHGTPKEKSQVYAAVAKKYPGLAARSSVPAVAEKAKKASVLEAILPTISKPDLDGFWDTLSNDPGLQAQFKKNAQASSFLLGLLAQHEPMTSEKVAAALPNFIRPSVIQVTRGGGGYLIKAANHDYWKPFTQAVSRGELVQRFGEKVAFAIDQAGAVTIADGADLAESEKVAEAQMIVNPGVYKVTTEDGRELVGFVIPNLVDTDGETLPLSFFTNGSQATVQSEIHGEESGGGANLPTGPIAGMGAFFESTPEGVHATIPMTLSGSYEAGGEPSTFVGETFDGRPVEVSLQDNIAKPIGMEEGKLLLPKHWQWTPMDKAENVALVGSEEAFEDPDAEKEAMVSIRSSGNTFSLSGAPVEKLAYEDREFIDVDQAMFVLAGLGVDQGYGATKLAHAMTGDRPETIKVGRFITPAAELHAEALESAREKLASIPNLKKSLIKEAAMIADPMAVDTVLSIGFLNPENLMTFVSYLPQVDEAQMRMCELLLAVRLGMQNVSKTALERAVRSTEEVLEGLKIIAFSQ